MDDAALQNGDAEHLSQPAHLPSTDQPTIKPSPAVPSKPAPAQDTADVAVSQPSDSAGSHLHTSAESPPVLITDQEKQNTDAQPESSFWPAPQPESTLGAPNTTEPEPRPQQLETTDGMEAKDDSRPMAEGDGAATDMEAAKSADVSPLNNAQATTPLVEERPASPQVVDNSLDMSVSQPSIHADTTLPVSSPSMNPPKTTLPWEAPQEPAPTPIPSSVNDEQPSLPPMANPSASSEPRGAVQSPVDQAMPDAFASAGEAPPNGLQADQSVADAPSAGISISTNVDQAPLDHSMTDAPSSSGKASRDRDEDDEPAPAAKRLKAEGESAEPEFKVPELPAHPPSSQAAGPEQTPVDEESITAPRINHMKKVIANLKKSLISAAFREAVNPVSLNIPTYFEIVKEPMDLGTVDRKLKSSSYEKLGDFVRDFNLIVDNAIAFNGREHQVTHNALKMKQSFDNQMKSLPPASLTLAVKEEKKVPKPKEHPIRSQRRVSTSQAPLSATGRSPVTPGSAQTFALGPQGVPLIRRDSTAPDGRPKRAIHPPKRRDQEFGPGRPRKKKFEWQLKFCKEVLMELKKPKYYDFAQYFHVPVDAVALNIPTYHKIIKKPMDLETVEKKLETNQYEKAKDFEEDVRLICKNCYAFNQPGDLVYTAGQQFERLFEEKWATKDEWLNSHVPASEPPSPSDERAEEEASEEEEEEESADERNHEIAQLKEQIAKMTQTIGNLQSGPPKKKKKATPPAPNAGKKAPKAKKKDSAGKSGGSATQPPGGRAKKKSSKSRVEKERFVTYNEKQYISTGISALPDTRMSEALKIIQSNVPSLKHTSQTEIELDIDELPNNVLLKLLDFVKEYSEQAPPEPEPAHPRPSAAVEYGAGTSGGGKTKKNKPMSKQAQELHIEDLKGKLNAYNGGHTPSDPVRSAEAAVESSADDDSEESEEE